MTNIQNGIAQSDAPAGGMEVATLGGGCFWCTEAVFQLLNGVQSVVSGYMGGSVDNPTYRQICTGTTGHAEVVQVTFDPSVVSYKELLRVFLTTHDPTTLNRQGADMGTQYRSVIFYHSLAQKTAAEEVIREIEQERVWRNKIVTEIAPVETFYVAEDYHQNYFLDNPGQGYCRVIIEPKVTKFRKQYMQQLKA